MFERQQARMDGSPSMSLLNDLGQRCKTVKQLVSWLKKIENDKALDILEYTGNQKTNMLQVQFVTFFNGLNVAYYFNHRDYLSD